MINRKQIKIFGCALLFLSTFKVLIDENKFLQTVNQDMTILEKVFPSSNSPTTNSTALQESETEPQLLFIMHIGPPKTATRRDNPFFAVQPQKYLKLRLI